MAFDRCNGSCWNTKTLQRVGLPAALELNRNVIQYDALETAAGDNLAASTRGTSIAYFGRPDWQLSLLRAHGELEGLILHAGSTGSLDAAQSDLSTLNSAARSCPAAYNHNMAGSADMKNIHHERPRALGRWN